MPVPLSARTPESCPHREAGLGGVSRHCGLIDQLLNGGAEIASEVSLDVCQACCRSFEPTVRDWNPVIASLVWSAVDELLTTVDAGRSDEIAHWQALLARAESSLPPVFPEEDDLPAWPQDESDFPRRTVDEVARVLPLPVERVGQVARWAVGVTTAPRRAPTLHPCLRSVIAAGWPSPHLFMDGEVDVPAEFSHLARTLRAPALGARQSYYLAIAELLERHPDAQALLIVQDDAYWPSHLPMREYLERCLWPGSEPGLVSAWCCTDDTAAESGWHLRDRPWRLGAVAFIYSREAAERFVGDPLIQQQCSCHPENPSGGISSLVGDWAARAGVPVYYPTPSLVQHLGEVSTIWENSRAVGVRRASRFIGDEV